jgi:hypothetical protein
MANEMPLTSRTLLGSVAFAALLTITQNSWAECPAKSSDITTTTQMQACFDKMSRDAAQAEARVQALQQRIDALESQLTQIKKFAPLSFTAKGCEVGTSVGQLFALYDSNQSPKPPNIFALSGENVLGMTNHEWAILHVCTW